MNFFILCAILLTAGTFLLSWSFWNQQLKSRQVAQRIGGNQLRSGHNRPTEGRDEKFLRRVGRLDNEIHQLLNILGWRRAHQRTLFSLLQVITPLVFMGIAGVWQLLQTEPKNLGVTLIFAAGIGYLLPKRILTSKAKARQECLSEEVSTVLPVLRILFEVGMTVEQALRILANEGQAIAPELASELKQILLRVDAGLELGEELENTARLLAVSEVNDCFTILRQLLHQGGGALASLNSMKALLDDRRMTSIQERVSKMSAKMSVVMMLFLFPALLMVLGGPGFIAIVNALGNMR